MASDPSNVNCAQMCSDLTCLAKMRGSEGISMCFPMKVHLMLVFLSCVCYDMGLRHGNLIWVRSCCPQGGERRKLAKGNAHLQVADSIVGQVLARTVEPKGQQSTR